MNLIKNLLSDAGIGAPYFSYQVNENKTSFLQPSLLDAGNGTRAEDTRKNRLNLHTSLFCDGPSLHMDIFKVLFGL